MNKLFLLLLCFVFLTVDVLRSDVCNRSLKKEFLQNIQDSNVQNKKIIINAFKQFEILKKRKESLKYYLDSLEIKTLFFLSTKEYEAVYQAQFLMLICLYDVYFSQATNSLCKALHKILYKLKNLKHLLSPSLKHSFIKTCCYGLHYEEILDRQIAQLVQIQQEVASVLGMVRYAKFYLQKFKNIDDGKDVLTFGMIPLYDYCHKCKTNDLQDLFKNLQVVHSCVENLEHKVIGLLESQTSQLLKWCSRGAKGGVLASCVTGLYFLYNYYQKQDIKKGKQKPLRWILFGKDIFAVDFCDFLKSYEQKNLDKSWLSGFFSYKQKKDFEKECADYLRSWYQIVGMAYEYIRTACNLDKKDAVILLFSMYGAYIASSNVYKYYMHNNGYLKRLRVLIRELDIQLNLLVERSNVSFADEGMVFYITNCMRKNIKNLSYQEAVMMKCDCEELVSFDVSYVQKYRIIERMYRTYEFLK